MDEQCAREVTVSKQGLSDSFLHSAATGMTAQQNYIDASMANVNTAGYKSRINFQDLIYQTDVAPGSSTTQQTESPTGIQVGIGVRTASTQKEFALGSLKATSNLTDVAINGDGFFQIKCRTEPSDIRATVPFTWTRTVIW